MSKRKPKTDAELKADRDARAAKGLCRTCDDDTTADCRELCWRDYRAFYRGVKSGKVDESEAVAAGLVAPSNYAKGESGFVKAARKLTKVSPRG